MVAAPVGLATLVVVLAVAFRRSFGRRSSPLHGGLTGGGCMAWIGNTGPTVGQTRDMLIAAVALAAVFLVVATVTHRRC